MPQHPLSDELAMEAAELVRQHGGVKQAARATGVSYEKLRRRHEVAVRRGFTSSTGTLHAMKAAGLEELPTRGGGYWSKTHEKDEHGRTYSFYVPLDKNENETTPEEQAAELAALMDQLPIFEPPKYRPKKVLPFAKAFIPINDLHAGAYAWSKETGYGDWDTDIAIERLTRWSDAMLQKLEPMKELILFWNGDTFHTNGTDPMTPTSGHLLDTDSRFFRVADRTIAAAVILIDKAARLHEVVRIVVKKGNHDRDTYLNLLFALKYRYKDWPNVIVEEDPSPYWAHQFGRVFLFGHHGDRVKPEQLVMKMAADHPDFWGMSLHRTVWTAHKHQREMKTFHGATWEQASCITDPDAYGAYWGNHAQMQAVVYDYTEGEVERYTVRSRA